MAEGGRFDAEQYLRFLGEEELLVARAAAQGAAYGARVVPWTPVAVAAGALVAVGAVEPDTADRIVAEYRAAAALRTAASPVDLTIGPARATPLPAAGPLPVEGPRVVPVGDTFPTEWGRLVVHYVALGGTTAVAVTAFESAPGAIAASPPTDGRPVGTSRVVDEFGGEAWATFQGSGMASGKGYAGRLVTDRPLARDTLWIELDGLRIDLTGRSPDPVTVSDETFPPAPPAEAYVDRALLEIPHSTYDVARLLEDPQRSPVATIVAALQAAGALAPDHPAPTVARRLAGERLLTDEPPADLPEPWRSMAARRGKVDGPLGVRALGVTVAALAGHPIALEALTSDLTVFSVRAKRLSPRGPVPAERRSVLDPLDVTAMGVPAMRPDAITWWADDDVGNHYLGHAYGSLDGRELTINFTPALDPAAVELRLRPTAADRRAVVRVPLEWADPT